MITKIKLKKKSEATEKMQMEIVGLILSLIIIIVVVAFIVRILNQEPEPDPYALAFFNRVVQDISYLEDGGNVVEIINTNMNSKFLGQKGYWGIAFFDLMSQEIQSGMNSYMCTIPYSLNNQFFQDEVVVSTDGTTRSEHRCKENSICVCLTFVSEKQSEFKINYAQCESIYRPYDLEKNNLCFLINDALNFFNITFFSSSIFLNSEYAFDEELANAIANAGGTIDSFDNFIKNFKAQISNLNSPGGYITINNSVLHINEFKEDYGIALYRKKDQNLDPELHAALVYKDPSVDLFNCFRETVIYYMDGSQEEAILIENGRIKSLNGENCDLIILKEESLTGSLLLITEKPDGYSWINDYDARFRYDARYIIEDYLPYEVAYETLQESSSSTNLLLFFKNHLDDSGEVYLTNWYKKNNGDFQQEYDLYFTNLSKVKEENNN